MEQEYRKTFQVGAGCHVEVSNVRGSTHVEAWDKPEVEIVARRRAGGGYADEATQLDIGQEGDKVWARVRPSSGEWLSWFGAKRVAAVDFQIRVPHQCRVSTSMVSGATYVKGVHESLKLSTVSGDAALEDIAGKISFNTVSGDITASQLQGEVKLNTVSGDVIIQQSELETIHGNSVSGDIRVATRLADDGHYAFSSVSGDVRLSVPPDTRCTAQLSTLSGDIRTSLPHEVLEDRRTSKRYKINGGGVVCALNSVSGDLRIVSAEGEEAVKARPQEAESSAVTEERPASHLTRMDILKAIESGEMSVQEGLQRLQELPFEQ